MTVLLAFVLPLFSCFVAPALVRSQNEARPSVVTSHAPLYPSVASLIHASGKVFVDVSIAADGRVTSATARGSAHPVLRSASEEASMNWRFEPASQGAQERWVVLTFDFIPDTSCNPRPVFRTPYDAEVRPTVDTYNASDTEDERPSDASSRRCPVHRLRLKEDKVEIAYGLMGYKPGYLEAEKKLFPYANTNVGGGCVIDMAQNLCTGKEVQMSPKFALVLYCPKCRAAQKRWSDAHPWPRG